MIHCRDVTEQATEYMEGEMSLLRKALFLLHVGFCVHCLRYLRQLREAVRSLRDLPPAPVEPEVTEGLLEAFRKEHASS